MWKNNHTSIHIRELKVDRQKQKKRYPGPLTKDIYSLKNGQIYIPIQSWQLEKVKLCILSFKFFENFQEFMFIKQKGVNSMISLAIKYKFIF